MNFTLWTVCNASESHLGRSEKTSIQRSCLFKNLCCIFAPWPDLLVLSAAAPPLAWDGDLHFGSQQRHGRSHQHQVGQTLLHHHGRHVRLLRRITRLLCGVKGQNQSVKPAQYYYYYYY